ncbi:MAG: FN3 associated domain-containing protein, partial [Verrucomicrobiales bacterium]|nr:FN3 associated domain-containing protein [Verrucomicrobiales bacterium]
MSETPGATIRYTTDGTAPTTSNGTGYSAPLTIAAPDSKTAIVIRARSFAPGLLPSGTKTQTYLVAQDSLLTTAPTLAITGDPRRDLFKPHGITAIEGGTYTDSNDNTLNALWQASGPGDYNTPSGRGRAYERETHLEYYFPPAFYTGSQEPYRGDVGIRLSSSPWSRPRLTLRSTHLSPWIRSEKEKPSFNLFWRGDFGSSKLDYPIFPGYSVSTFDNLRLRAGKN